MFRKQNIEQLFDTAVRRQQAHDLDGAVAIYDQILEADSSCTDA